MLEWLQTQMPLGFVGWCHGFGDLKTLLKTILECVYVWSLTVECSGRLGFGVSSQALGCPPIAFSSYASDVGAEL